MLKWENQWHDTMMFRFIGKTEIRQKEEALVTMPLGCVFVNKFFLGLMKIFIRLIPVQSVDVLLR
jgi:hypothetical protein